MLHQILFALLGKTGSIIRQYDNKFRVDPTVTILNQSQINSINQLVQVGYHYKQIFRFIQTQSTDIAFLDIKRNPSIYRKSIAQGLKKALKEYQELILGIQNDYLQNKYFTFSNIKAETIRFQVIMKQIWSVLSRIIVQKYRGGIVIDIFWDAYHKGSQWLRSWISLILQACQKIFVNQIVAWIAHGQLIDPNNQFFIHKVIQQEEYISLKNSNNKKNEMTGWDNYTIDTQLIPFSIISQETAGKILFIGKSIKILKSSGKISSLPDTQICKKITLLYDNQYCQIKLQSVIQEIRKIVAEEMIRLIIGEQNLLKQLKKINQYYLMTNGQFYHYFLQQAKLIQNHISNRQKIQKKINQTCLQNTFIRLNNLQDSKKISFQIKPIGFSYINFKSFINICPVGNIDLIQGKYARFSSNVGGIWHRTKQIVQNNFTITMILSFKKSKNIFKSRKEQNNDKKSNIISVVIQNYKDISPSNHQNPNNLQKLNEYLAINIGYKYNQISKLNESIVYLTYRNQKKYNTQIQIAKILLNKINLADQSNHIIKIIYQNEQIKISINPMSSYQSSQQNNYKISQIRMSSYLNLQMNRAYIGILSNINQNNCIVELQQWQMVCKSVNHYGDYWSDLSLNLTINWPVNLILTNDIMEMFSRIHKFLFPIRQTQIQLQKIWFKISRKMKQAKSHATSKIQLYDLCMFQRRISSTRFKMSAVINNLWSYFQNDVIQTAWNKLKICISESHDFQDVMKMVAKYVNTVQTMFYFNYLKIQKGIHQILRQCRQFIIYFNRLEGESVVDQKNIKQYQLNDQTFTKNLSQFTKVIKDLSKTSNSTHLFHLSQRMQSCQKQQLKFIGY